jgi:hypothetical protein
MNFSDRFQVQLSIVFCLQIMKTRRLQHSTTAHESFSPKTRGYLFIKAFFLILFLKEQLGDILFISFEIKTKTVNIIHFPYLDLSQNVKIRDVPYSLKSPRNSECKLAHIYGVNKGKVFMSKCNCRSFSVYKL